MNIAIFGIGYVGSVCGACLASAGHRLIAVDVQLEKVRMINAAECPIVEPGLPELLARVVASGNLRATIDVNEAVSTAEVSMICVGTPSREDGSLNLDYVIGVCRQIGEAIKAKLGFHTIVLRSTVLPGTVEHCTQIIAEASGRIPDVDFTVAYNPEFLREGNALKDFREPPLTLIGTAHLAAEQALRGVYQHVDAPLIVVPIRPAETIKYVNNAYHALKVAFANEVGTICKSLDIDSHIVMDLFCRDTQLNISKAYFRPGYAFGGSCLPKDLRAVTALAASQSIELPLLESILQSNDIHKQRGIDLVLATGKTRIGLLGLSFKEGTDDLRESPLLNLLNALQAAGKTVRIYDPNVDPARLVGANESYAKNHLGDLFTTFSDTMADVLDNSECIVIGNANPEFSDVLAQVRPDQIVIDLVRLEKNRTTSDNYQGICW